MFDSVTATSVVAVAGQWSSTGFMVPVLIALGMIVVLGLASWVFSIITNRSDTDDY